MIIAIYSKIEEVAKGVGMLRRQIIFIIVISLSALLFQNCGSELRSKASALSSSVGLSAASVNSSADQVELLKYQACMFDGLLVDPVSGQPGADFNDNVKVLSRSNCKILPRAIETWTAPPNFQIIKNSLDTIKAQASEDLLYGMFIAEAISTTAVYRDDSGQVFDFPSMCQVGTQGQWGVDTCVPNSEHPEFQRYIYYITEKAMALGVTDFLFGQLGHLDKAQVLPSILEKIRGIAQRLGVVITIGGQPNGVVSEAYLRSFDYIITPSYIDDVLPSQIRSNEYSQCKTGTNCQAVYFHPNLASKANAVIAEIDWSSLDDDAHRFGKKTKEERHSYAYELSQALREKGIGFILPFRLWYDGGAQQSCVGFNEWVYSASNDFQCADEDAWNLILEGRRPESVDLRMSDSEIRDSIVELFMSAMGRTFAETISDVEGINFWVLQVKNGVSFASVRSTFLSSNEYFVRQQYLQILKRRADFEGLTYFMSQIEEGAKNRQDVIDDLMHACANHINGECL